jgi:hypothetical protein
LGLVLELPRLLECWQSLCRLYTFWKCGNGQFVAKLDRTK